jgi:hypothetical protein
MTTPRRFVETSQSEEYLHKETWRVVLRQLDSAEKNERGGLYDDLVAMVFAFLSFEGYLHFVGERVAPKKWKKLRKDNATFREKFEVICGLCEIEFLEFERPFSTIFELRELRNRIAHPKPHRDDETSVEFIEGNDPEIFPPTFLQRLVDHKKALRAREDVKRISDLIHDSANSRFPSAELGPDGLGGVLSMRTTSTKLLPPEGE